MELDVIYKIPAFVKEASEEQLNADRSDAVVVSGLRIDTKPAAWRAAASLRKMAMFGEHIEPTTADMVKKACHLFNITDADFQLNDVPGDHVIVKTASDGAEFVICDNEQFNTAVDSVIKERTKRPLDFVRKCASSLLEVQDKNGYTTDASKRDFLCKIAGTAYIDSNAFKSELQKRVTYAYNMHMDKEAETLRKLASLCRHMSDDNQAFTNILIEGIDVFDKDTGLINKLASEGMHLPEQVVYLNDAEGIRKQANTKLDLGNGLSVRKATVMNYENMEAISKWASDIGRDLPSYSDCDTVVSFVKGLSDNLKKEFVDTFGL